MNKIVTAFLIIFFASCGESDSSSPPDTSLDPKLTKIEISGSTSPIYFGVVTSLQLTAAGFDQFDNPFSAMFIWSSSDTLTTKVDSTGLVTIISVGSINIKAESQGVSQSVFINIISLPPAPSVTSLMLDDITNNGNASDFEISFTKVPDESKISEYRVIMVKSAVASGFQASTANAVSADRYMSVAKTNSNAKVTLPTNSLDSDGEAIIEGTLYTAFVLSVADGINAKDNALSAPSNSIKAAQTTVKITFVADDGVIITDGTKTVIVDAMPPSFSVNISGTVTSWIPAASGLITAIQNGTPPYDNISVILVTHDHLDHWAIGSTGNFLNSHSQAKLIGPPQVVSNFTGNAQVVPLNPALFQSEETTIDGIKVKALRMVHFNNFGLDFSSIQNFAFLIEIGGKKILHLGDADYTTQNFSPFDLVNENVDVVIVPAATIKLTSPNMDIVRSLIAPEHIIAAHLETNKTESQVKAVWGNDIDVFTKSLQFLRY